MDDNTLVKLGFQTNKPKDNASEEEVIKWMQDNYYKDKWDSKLDIDQQ